MRQIAGSFISASVDQLLTLIGMPGGLDVHMSEFQEFFEDFVIPYLIAGHVAHLTVTDFLWRTLPEVMMNLPLAASALECTLTGLVTWWLCCLLRAMDGEASRRGSRGQES